MVSNALQMISVVAVVQHFMPCLKEKAKQKQKTAGEHDMPFCFPDYFFQQMLYLNGL